MVSLSSLLPKNAGHGDGAVLILQNNQQTNPPKNHKQQNKCLGGGVVREIYTSSQIVCLYLRGGLDASLLKS